MSTINELMVHAVHSCYPLDDFKGLVEQGGDINHKEHILDMDSYSYYEDHFDTILMSAIAFKCYDIAKYLIEKGADVNIKNGEGGSAFTTAIDKKRYITLSRGDPTGINSVIKALVKKIEPPFTIVKAKKDHKTDCPICLGTFKKGDNMALIHKKSRPNQTPHIFHQECIGEWLENNDNCPLCRGKDLKFGKKRKSLKTKSKVLLTKALKNKAKKHKVKLTIKRGNKRVYKSEKMLKEQISNAIKRS